MNCNTVEPLYYGYFGTLVLVLTTEVSSIQGSLNILQYHAGTQYGVLTTEVSTFQRFVIERFHCTQIRLDVIHFSSSVIFRMVRVQGKLFIMSDVLYMHVA